MLHDTGIQKASLRFYHEPDSFTAENLYHTPHVGVYCCNAQYQFEHTADICLNIGQAILVDSGMLTLQYRGQETQADAGMLLLLDCREPFRYFAASSEVHFRWFHIAGCSSLAYLEHITGQHGFAIPCGEEPEIQKFFSQIITDAQEHAEPHLVSLHVHALLTALSCMETKQPMDALTRAIIDSSRYIDAHFYEKEVKIPFLASRAALSTCYYLRKFKEYHHMTPHQYLQRVRLRAAKEQLITTSLSMEEIAERCGFCNTSHFVMSFRKSIGQTPLQFRTMWK